MPASNFFRRSIPIGIVALATACLLSASPTVAAELACSNPAIVSIIKGEADKFVHLAFESADGVAMGADVDISLSNYLPTRSDENTKDCTANLTIAYKGHTASDAIAYTAGKTEDGNFVAQWGEPGAWARGVYEQWCMQAGVRPQSLAERLQKESARSLTEFMNKKTYAADPDWSPFHGQ